MEDLILTRLQEFWPLHSTEPILLGPWCLPLPTDDIEAKHYSLLSCPWTTYKDVAVAYEEAQEIYNKIIPNLSKALNLIHNKNYPDRYWQILIGPWVNSFAHVVYDRYKRLCLALDKYKDINIIGLDIQDCLLVPKDTIDSVILSNHSEIYNLQLLTTIAIQMGINITLRKFSKHTEDLENATYISTKGKSLQLKFYEYCINKFWHKADTVCYGTGLPSKFLAKLFVYSFGKIIERQTVDYKINYSAPDYKMRGTLERIIKSEFFPGNQLVLDNLILGLVHRMLPKIFLEEYSKLDHSTLR